MFAPSPLPPSFSPSPSPMPSPPPLPLPLFLSLAVVTEPGALTDTALHCPVSPFVHLLTFCDQSSLLHRVAWVGLKLAVSLPWAPMMLGFRLHPQLGFPAFLLPSVPWLSSVSITCQAGSSGCTPVHSGDLQEAHAAAPASPPMSCVATRSPGHLSQCLLHRSRGYGQVLHHQTPRIEVGTCPLQSLQLLHIFRVTEGDHVSGWGSRIFYNLLQEFWM